MRGHEIIDYIFKPFDAYILQSKIKVSIDLFQNGLEIKRQAALLQETERDIRSRELAQRNLESLQRYRNLAEAIPHVVWKADTDGRVTYFNRRWEELTGQGLAHSLCGATNLFRAWFSIVRSKSERLSHRAKCQNVGKKLKR